MKPENANMKMQLKRQMTLGFTGVAGFHFWDRSSPKEDGTYHTELWKNTFRAQNHMNGDDVINTLSEGGGYWGQTKEKRYLKAKHYEDKLSLSSKQAENAEPPLEMQAYISNDKNKIVGYVRNNTYNVFTKRINDTSNCFNNYVKNTFPYNTLFNLRKEYKYAKDGSENWRVTNRLKIAGLPNLELYNIDFYTLDSYVSSTERITTYSKLELDFPELYVEEHWQNRPVIWFVANREGYNGMMQNYDFAEDSTDVFLMELLANEQATFSKISPVRVYPNPSKDYITIESPIDDEIIIQEPSGRVVLQQKTLKGKNRILLQNFSQGVYILHFKNININYKIIKE